MDRTGEKICPSGKESKVAQKVTIGLPVEGQQISLDQVNNKMFASGMMGQGFAVLPTSNIICAPMDGLLRVIFPTKHVFGIQASNGLQILVHIGIDTVESKGKGFKQLVEVGTKVKKGQPIIEVDTKALSQDYDMVVICTYPNGENYKIKQGKDGTITARLIGGE